MESPLSSFFTIKISPANWYNLLFFISFINSYQNARNFFGVDFLYTGDNPALNARTKPLKNITKDHTGMAFAQSPLDADFYQIESGAMGQRALRAWPD